MTETWEGSHASAKAPYPESAERPINPGSAMHPTGCKPCNKYNPARPRDSCKHGVDCDFCHGPHERPKHRGQRGRHALQRRQYLESKADQPKEYCALIDQIYKVPHDAVEDVKTKLSRMVPQEKEARVLMVLDTIRTIGEQAQDARPDNSRLRGARINSDGCVSAAELDGRCKWLVGTLHLMVRKMWDAKEDFEKINEVVQGLLLECKRLPDVLDIPPSSYRIGGQSRFSPVSAAATAMSHNQQSSHAEKPSGSGGLRIEDSSDLRPHGGQEDYEWLRLRVEVLEQRAREDSESEEEMRKVVIEIKQACGFLHGHMSDEQKEILKKSRSLWDLRDALDREHEAAKEKLLQLDDLDNEED